MTKRCYFSRMSVKNNKIRVTLFCCAIINPFHRKFNKNGVAKGVNIPNEIQMK